MTWWAYLMYIDQTFNSLTFVWPCRSLVELANEREGLNEAQADQLIDSLFQNAGLQDKNVITFNDFHRLLSDYEKELNYASLDWSGELLEALTVLCVLQVYYRFKIQWLQSSFRNQLHTLNCINLQCVHTQTKVDIVILIEKKE